MSEGTANVDERREIRLSDDQFEAIAKRAADIAREDFYAAVGRTIVGIVLRYGGAGLGAIALWEAIKIGLKP
jgi:hypothetical protein